VPSSLPKTGSFLPLLWWAGLLALGVSFALRSAARRIA
jgi:LPXTG-motif cell wall-anchored protein